MRNVIILVILILANHFSSYAQGGVLDNSFDSDGMLTLDISNSNDVMKSMVIQPDGKILVAGYTSDMITDEFCLLRFNTDGSLDVGFGVSGIVITSFPFTSVASDIALQLDGKIVVAGHTWSGTNNVFALARYHSDGVLDTTFGSSGLVTSSFPGKGAIARSLKIQSDGKIVAAGHIYTLETDWDEFALSRFNLDGTLDTTFGSEGQVTTSFGVSTKNWINEIQIQNDGRIVAGGFSNDVFALARYLPNGNLDSTFGESGLKTTFIPGTTQGVINAIVLKSDGSIFAGGFSTDTLNDFTVVKYDSLGTLVSSFGVNGILVDQISTENDAIADMLIQPNGALLAAGSSSTSGLYQFALTSYDSTGNIDTTFGTNGVAKTSISSSFNQLESISLQPDGKILATGFVDDYPYDLAVVRYTSTILSTSDPLISIEDFSVYPNPALDQLHVTFTTKTNGLVSLQLYDFHARLLEETKLYTIQGAINREAIELENCSAGIYFIKINTPYSNQMVKFIKY